MQIVVLGSQRSGASVATRLINMMGAAYESGKSTNTMENLTGGNVGFWENAAAVSLNDTILGASSASWKSLSEWKMTKKPSAKLLSEIKVEKVNEGIQAAIDGFDSKRTSVIKDPRLCLTLPFWKDKLTTPIAVIVYRHPAEVAMSLQARHDFSLAHGVALWEYYYTGVLNATKGMTTFAIEHGELVTNPMKVLKSLHATLKKEGIKDLKMPPKKEVEAFVQEQLWRSKADDEARAALTSEHNAQLIAMLSGKKKVPATMLQPSLAAQDAMIAYGTIESRDERMVEINRDMASRDQEHGALKGKIDQMQTQIESLNARNAERFEFIEEDEPTGLLARIFGKRERDAA